MALDLAWARAQFPALARQHRGAPIVFFDGPAGSQTPQPVIDAMVGYLTSRNANTHGEFATSRDSDAALAAARAALAELLGAADPAEVVFGANSTTQILAVSRAIGRTLRPGDEVVVTTLDHDANLRPWRLAARDADATLREVRLLDAGVHVDLDRLAAAITPATRVVAVTAASNAIGSLVAPADAVAAVRRIAPDAVIAIDAVHLAPHRRMHVAAWGADLVFTSAYKYFGPHVGVMWGRRALLERLPAYRVEPAGDELPGKWETGTQNHEGIAGAHAAVDYLAEVGRRAGGAGDRRAQLDAAFAAVAAHENALCDRLLAGLDALSAYRVWGVAEPGQHAARVPTVAVTHARVAPAAVAEALAERGIQVWNGDFYAVELVRELGRAPDGLIRLGMLHYNAPAEVDRVLEALAEIR